MEHAWSILHMSCGAAGILLHQLKAAGPTAEAGKGNTLVTLTSLVSGKLIDLAVNANSIIKCGLRSCQCSVCCFMHLLQHLCSHCLFETLKVTCSGGPA